MKAAAILASDDMMPGAANERADSFERDEQMGKLVPALAGVGITAELVPWRTVEPGAYDVFLPLLCWDYWTQREAFLAQMAALGSVLNPPDMLAWNTDKSYLARFGKGGLPIIPTETVERVSATVVEQAFDRFGTDKLVIKPEVGAGAWRQAMVRRGEALPAPDVLPSGRAMIQPFLTSVQEEGEVSLLFFGGEFSHGLRKLAKAGDYRIQSLYGGREVPFDPSEAMLALAAQALTLAGDPLYARVDLIRDNKGDWCVIELELVEPYLYLDMSDGEGGENAGAQAFARALRERLN